MVVSLRVGANIFILGVRNKIFISFNQAFINRLRKYRLLKETFDHEIHNDVTEQNYHNKVMEIKIPKKLFNLFSVTSSVLCHVNSRH